MNKDVFLNIAEKKYFHNIIFGVFKKKFYYLFIAALSNLLFSVHKLVLFHKVQQLKNK